MKNNQFSLWRSSLRKMILAAIFVFLLDQSSKFLISRWGITWGIAVVLNPGISASWGAGWLQAQPIWLTGIFFTGFLSCFLIAVLFLLPGLWQKFPWEMGLFIGGALGNVWDRWWFGGVRDWWQLWLWPAWKFLPPPPHFQNNLADWAIAAAVGLLIGKILIKRLVTDRQATR
jgi:lipoprotein signal peptidase